MYTCTFDVCVHILSLESNIYHFTSSLHLNYSVGVIEQNKILNSLCHYCIQLRKTTVVTWVIKNMFNFKFTLCFILLLIFLLISETKKFRHPLYSHQQNSAELTPNPPSSSPSPTPPSSGCGNCLGFPWIYHNRIHDRCTTIYGDNPWCSTSNGWEYCTDPSCPGVAPPTEVMTVSPGNEVGICCKTQNILFYHTTTNSINCLRLWNSK